MIIVVIVIKLGINVQIKYCMDVMMSTHRNITFTLYLGYYQM